MKSSRKVEVPAGKPIRLMKWPTWHIIGNSPSILDEDLSGLKNTIGLNRILRHKTFTPDYLLLVDESVLHWERKRIDAYQGKIIRWEGMRGPLSERFTRGETFAIDECYLPIRNFEGPFTRSCNTALYATEWAARKLYPGRGQIVWHGADFKTVKGLPTHFFGNGEREGTSSNSWHSVLKNLTQSVTFLWQKNIRVINASPWSGPLDRIMPRLAVPSK